MREYWNNLKLLVQLAALCVAGVISVFLIVIFGVAFFFIFIGGIVTLFLLDPSKEKTVKNVDKLTKETKK